MRYTLWDKTQFVNMTQTTRNRKVEGKDTDVPGQREDDAHIPESVPRVKKKDGPNDVYVAILILGAVFVLGFVCGRALGNFGSANVATSEVPGIIALLREKKDNHLLQAADIENLKELVQELKYSDSTSPLQSKDPKHVSEMSHKEAMETLSEPVNPNAHTDYILGQLYNFLLIAVIFVFLIIWTCIGGFNK